MSDTEKYGGKVAVQPHDEELGAVTQADGQNKLHTDLKSRHMQMIAIGGAIGAGLFIGSGGALYKGGPAALVIGYCIVGAMLLLTMQALAELAVLYPVNGAFFSYVTRFVDPAWGFAMGWDYALAWLIVLPFELIAAGLTIRFWNDTIPIAVWVSVFLVLLCLIQIFGVRGYGEVEFVLSMIKIAACVGFMIFGIIVNVGAVGNKGYMGVSTWTDPGAFKNGFNGFCSVFVVAAFAFGGTELVGLAAAESANPRKAVPLAAKQVFFRVAFFYIVNLFILGLILRSDDPRLAKSSGANSSASPFILAIQDAGVSVLPSIFNAVITISVISVANSCTFGSTRTIQAMAARGMAPKFLGYVDKAGRPLWCVLIQLAFGLLGYLAIAANGMTVLYWLLALSGLSFFFVWGSCCLAHIRFRMAWTRQGYSLNEIPYRAPAGIWGSAVGFGINVICLVATAYNALYPSPNAVPNVEDFFMSYLAAPITLVLYLGYKVVMRDWTFCVPLATMDLKTGIRHYEEDEIDEKPKTWANLPLRILRALF
ncbi:putative amino acid permease [Microdochium nivale]|nr:putative amino acid permease [Microdochium nivale]